MGIPYTHMEALLREARDRIDNLRVEIRQLQMESTSQRCGRLHIQACDICEHIDCCDNQSDAKRRIEELKKALITAMRYIDDDVPEAPSHVCGTPDAQCDGSCADYARYVEWKDSVRNALKKNFGPPGTSLRQLIKDMVPYVCDYHDAVFPARREAIMERVRAVLGKE